MLAHVFSHEPENKRIQVDICGEKATALEFWLTQTLTQIHKH